MRKKIISIVKRHYTKKTQPRNWSDKKENGAFCPFLVYSG